MCENKHVDMMSPSWLMSAREENTELDIKFSIVRSWLTSAREENMGWDIKLSICSVIFVVLEICIYVGGWGRRVGPTLVSSPF
jgi:hypothetical protein